MKKKRFQLAEFQKQKCSDGMVENAVGIYYTTKHSWRGKHKRLFALPEMALTFNPQSPAEITNTWPWAELNGLTLDTTGKQRSQQEFLLHIRKKGKVTKYFSLFFLPKNFF